MEIITRERWHAAHEDGFGSAPLPAEEVWLHHSVTLMPDVEWIDANRDGVEDEEAAAMRQLEDIGEDRFGRGISYTFGVVPAGRIYEGHGVDRQGAHTKGRNDRARAIVWLGNFDLHKPTTAMIRATAWLLQEGVRRGWWRRARLNGGHQQAPGAATACPGTWAMAAIPEINRLAAGPPIDDPRPAYTEDDMAGITYLVTTNDSTKAHSNDGVERKGRTYCASSNGSDLTVRQVSGGELAALTRAGVKPVTLPGRDFADLLTRALAPAEKE